MRFRPARMALAVLTALAVVTGLGSNGAAFAVPPPNPGLQLTTEQGSPVPATEKPGVADYLTRQGQRTYTTDPRTIGPNGPRIPRMADWKTECLNHVIPPDESSRGWIKDHFSWCWHGKIIAKGSAQWTADFLLLGTGGKNARTINFHTEVTNFKPLGSPVPSGVLNLTPSCEMIAGTPGSCDLNGGEVSRTVQQWQANPNFDFSFTSPDAGEKVEKVVNASFKLVADVPQSGGLPLEIHDYIRFDSASYLLTKKGAIFSAILPSFPLNGKDPTIRHSVKHISDACNRPEDTYPEPADGKKKVVAGCSRTNIIHRLKHDTSRRKKNRSTAIAACRSNWGNGYPTDPDGGEKRDCDEYPYSCSYEGAAQPNYDTNVPYGMFSARPIPRTDNRTSGSQLGVWYSNDRILDFKSAANWPNDPQLPDKNKRIEDTFWVRIIDDPNLTFNPDVVKTVSAKLRAASADDEDPLDCNGA